VSLSSGALSAMAIVGLQYARIRDSLLVALAAACAGPSAPIAWILLDRAGGGLSLSASIVCITQAVGVALLAIPLVGSMCRLSWSDLRGASYLRTSLLMLPHLLAFSVLMQGIRLTSVVFDRSQLLLGSHDLMLAMTIATTLVVGFHSLISVRVQSAPEASFASQLRRFERQYLALGAVASTALYVLLSTEPRFLLPDLPRTTPVERLIFASGIASICGYYFLSTQCLRMGRTGLLAVVSVSSCLAFYGANFVLPQASLCESIMIYGFGLLAMPLALAATLRLRSRKPQGPVRTGTTRFALSFAPLIVVSVIVALAA
jgi:hypothetical protein